MGWEKIFQKLMIEKVSIKNLDDTKRGNDVKSKWANPTKLSALLKKFKGADVEGQLPENADIADPLTHFVHSWLLWEASTEQAKDAMEKILEAFVDFNELRVALPHEIANVVGKKYPKHEERFSGLKKSLQAIYLKHHSVTLHQLKDLSKKDARAFVDDLDGIHPFVSNRILHMSLGVHAIPCDEQLVHVLVEHDVLEEAVEVEKLGSWLTSSTKAADAEWTVFALQTVSDNAWSDGTITKINKRLRAEREAEENARRKAEAEKIRKAAAAIAAAEKKAAQKEAAEKKAAEKKIAAEKAAIKKAADKKIAEKKAAAKKIADKKAAVKKAAAKKAAAKKAAAKKAAAKKAAAKKAAAKKVAAKKVAAKKVAAKKLAAKKAAAKKKVAKKVSKKTTKKSSKKAAKKTTKKAAKKTAKKSSKKTSKKTAKKTAKKSSKKTAKKAAKKTAKKSVKKSVKKPAKKAAKKTAKKTKKKTTRARRS